jgi:hypothetical protein
VPRRVASLTEADRVWAVARRYLSPLGHVARVENPAFPGTPDVNYALRPPRSDRTLEGWFELKILPPSGAAPKHLTVDQIRWGETRAAAGGAWHLLARRGSFWELYDIKGARALFKGEGPFPLFSLSGRFPLREILRVLSG